MRQLRLLFVVDVYPPAPIGGGTLYAVQLAEEMVRRGHEVVVVCAGSWENGTAYFNGMTEEILNGVSVYRLFLNWRKAPAPFDFLYDNKSLAPIYRSLLSKHRPDVVHVHSCRTLSSRMIQEAKALNYRVIIHLHEFWFLCALQNLVRKSGVPCAGPESSWGCQSCLLADTKAIRWSAYVLPTSLQEGIFTRLGRVDWITRQPGLIGMLGDMTRRQAYLSEILAVADVVVAPSRSLTRKFETYGFRTDHMVYSLQGFDTAWASNVKHVPSDCVRFGYIGHIQQIKGVQTLIDAFNLLPEGINASLSVYGDPAQQPDFVLALKGRARTGIHWNGSFSRSDLATVLSGLDVVVVPSLGFEVNPTVIKEAFAARLPVIVSDQPGVCEMVEHGVNGLHFRTGQARDLADNIARVVNEPGLLSRLAQAIPSVKTISQSADEMEQIYNPLAG